MPEPIESPSLLLINPDPTTRNDLSLGYIAAYAREHGFAADVVDFAVDKPSLTTLGNLFDEHAPALTGIAAYQETIAEVIGLSQFIRERSDSRIVIGGPQVPPMPDRGLSELANVDYLCRGEGELVVLDLLRALSSGRSMEAVSGISYKQGDGAVTTNPDPVPPADLDAYPSPYLTGVLNRFYDPEREVIRITTARGCLFDCAFCLSPFLSGRQVRFHSIPRVVSEIEFLCAKGFRDFWIVDPTFTTHKERTRELLQAIIDSGVSASFWCETHFDAVDGEMLDLMKRAGVHRIAFGLESADRDVLQQLNKSNNIDRATEKIGMARNQGFWVELMHMIGNPGDTFESTMRTFDYIRDCGLHFDGNNKGQRLKLLFGTELLNDPENFGIVLPKAFNEGRYPGFLSPGTDFRTKTLSARDIANIEERQLAEVELAQKLGVVRLNKSHLGMSTEHLIRLPIQHLCEANEVFKGGRRPVPGLEPSCEFAILEVGEAEDRNRADILERVDAIVQQASFDAMLFLRGAKGCAFDDPKVLAKLLESIASPGLLSCSVCFSFTLSWWRENTRRFQTILRKLRAYDRPANGELRKPLFQNVMCVLELADAGGITSPEFHEMDETASKLGAGFLPLFVFDEADSTERFLQTLADVEQVDELMRFPVLALADEPNYGTLRSSYRNAGGASPLPPLCVVFRGMILYGARAPMRFPRKSEDGSAMRVQVRRETGSNDGSTFCE